jgi:hypothetical protein
MGLLDVFKKRHTDPRERFLREFEREVDEDTRFGPSEALPDQFAYRLRFSAGEEVLLHLENLFCETREQSPEDRVDRIRNCLSGVLDHAPREWADVAPRLLPVLRGCTYGAEPGAVGRSAVVRRPFLPFLDAMLAIDMPRTTGYVQRGSLEEWRISEDAAFEVALANAAPVTAVPLESYDNPHGPVWHVPGEEMYALTRLLRPGWLASMRDRVEGRPIAIFPERSTLFVGGDARPELVHWLAEKALREHQASSRSISPAVYTVNDEGTVVPYSTPRDDEVANLVRRGHVQLLGSEYNAQEDLLNRYHVEQRVDVFVAPVGMMTVKGWSLSWCSWVEGIESSLPRTDVVIAGGGVPKGDLTWKAIMPFEMARAIGGSLWSTAEAPFGPERFKVSGAISAEQKQALIAASCEPDDLR